MDANQHREVWDIINACMKFHLQYDIVHEIHSFRESDGRLKSLPFSVNGEFVLTVNKQ